MFKLMTACTYIVTALIVSMLVLSDDKETVQSARIPFQMKLYAQCIVFKLEAAVVN